MRIQDEKSVYKLEIVSERFQLTRVRDIRKNSEAKTGVSPRKTIFYGDQVSMLRIGSPVILYRDGKIVTHTKPVTSFT